jgi:hypothetical protein
LNDGLGKPKPRWGRGIHVSLTEARRVTLGDVIDRFIREALPGMKSEPHDRIRPTALEAQPIAEYSIATLTAARIAACLDERLTQVKPDTVLRELAFLSSVVHRAGCGRGSCSPYAGSKWISQTG